MNADVDVIVIGGGVNGTGVARDCVLRGMSVALFERNDIGFGASGNSSGMIHGGPRYLTKDPAVTYSSCMDSGHIQRIAPHMLFRVPFLVPVYGKGAAAWAELASYDAFFQVYDRYQYLKRGKKHFRFSSEEVSRLEPGLVRTGGAASFDEWGIDGVRLCVTSLVDAVERGARAFIHKSVVGVVRDEQGCVRGIRYADRQGREQGTLTARVVVNATGAWAPVTAASMDLPSHAARLRPGKGVHVFLDRRLSNFAIITKAVDGREVFLLPWQHMSVLGTTDDDYYGDLDEVVATTNEVRYLTQAIARVFPAVRQARAIGTWGGVRPTLYEWGPMESALSREHRIVDHAEHGASGLYSMLGGKLASYRLFAEEMTDVIARRLDVGAACQTHSLPLPGGEEMIDPGQLCFEYGIDGLTARRLVYRHGCRAGQVLADGALAPGTSANGRKRGTRMVCECECVLEAEVSHAIDNEWARSVEDVSRRTRLGLGPCGGMRCAVSCGHILAERRGLSPSQGLKSATDFLQGALRRRLPAVGPEQARAEALSVQHLAAQLGWSPRGKGSR